MLKNKYVRQYVMIMFLLTTITALVCGLVYFNLQHPSYRIVVLVLGVVNVLVCGTMLYAYTIYRIFQHKE